MTTLPKELRGLISLTTLDLSHCEHDNINGEIGELDFFDNTRFIQLFEHDNIAQGIGKLDFFDNP
jgi:hypothetical protein